MLLCLVIGNEQLFHTVCKRLGGVTTLQYYQLTNHLKIVIQKQRAPVDHGHFRSFPLTDRCFQV